MRENRIDRALNAVRERRGAGERMVVAVAGPPATGKSTFAGDLVRQLTEREGLSACVVPMDGFHLDNRQLDRLGLRDRKGSPPTFDFDGFLSLLERIRAADRVVYFPLFDRERDLAIAAAGMVVPDTDVVVVEGNYLMLDDAPWSRLAAIFDLEIFLDASIACLERRLIRRWLDHGHDLSGAERRARRNDIPNAELVLGNVRVSANALVLEAEE